MIDLILPDARLGFAQPLIQMHQDRKLVFVDQLGWRLPVRGSWLEVDEFDNELAVYLMARSPDGSHQGSLRLLPTVSRNMLGSLFHKLCVQKPPEREDCWEISRLVTRPLGAPGMSVLKVHRLLALALIEFAQLNAISAYTLVIDADRVPLVLSLGWKVRPLGLPTCLEGKTLQALQICIEASSLARMRAKYRADGPVLRVSPLGRKAA